jgi:hypothetical protein
LKKYRESPLGFEIPLHFCVVDIDFYEEDVPPAPLVPMAPERIVDLLRSAFHIGQLNQLRALDREQALLQRRPGEPTEPLEDYEFYYHKAQLVELLLEQGVPGAREYCRQRNFLDSETNKLMEEAKTFIVAASREQATAAKDFALARYNKLFERLYFNRDYKGAAMVQRCMDRLNGLENSDLKTPLEQGLLSLMQSIAREEGAVTATVVRNPENVVREVVAGSNIQVEHKLET